MKKFFLENWKLKLGSIALTILFYFNLQSSKILVKTVNLPIEYPKLPSNYYYSQTLEKSFPVRVEGLRETVNYYSQFMKVELAIEEIQQGEVDLPLGRISGVPSGMSVIPLRTSIPVVIEMRGSKSIPIEVSFEGSLPSEIEKISHSIKPETITIQGKEVDLEKIMKISIPPISLLEKRESFQKKYKVQEFLKGDVNSKTKEITLTVNLQASLAKGGEQTIYGIPVNCVGLSKYLDAEISETQVSIRYFSQKPIKPSQAMAGLQGIVLCSNSYDPVKKKIIPNNLPVISKVKIFRKKELKNLEILQIRPERVMITYKVKADFPEEEGKETFGFEEVKPNEDNSSGEDE